MALTVSLKTPTAEEYNELRQLAGWPVLADDVTKQGLSNSLFSVVIHNEDNLTIGMGRIVGDGAIYFHILDVIVRPAFQRRGIGKMIMKELLNYLNKVGAKNSHVGLMCSKGREEFYKGFSFIERPNERFGSGMIRIKE